MVGCSSRKSKTDHPEEIFLRNYAIDLVYACLLIWLLSIIICLNIMLHLFMALILQQQQRLINKMIQKLSNMKDTLKKKEE